MDITNDIKKIEIVNKTFKTEDGRTVQYRRIVITTSDDITFELSPAKGDRRLLDMVFAPNK